LIVGIQGCGKSLAAKTIAREWKMPLLKLDAGRLYDKYVGSPKKLSPGSFAGRKDGPGCALDG
jgi:SpoVK/Ycf46/Vps4 family AAA+-type ATPase